jgi:hypothetical protein
MLLIDACVVSYSFVRVDSKADCITHIFINSDGYLFTVAPGRNDDIYSPSSAGPVCPLASNPHPSSRLLSLSCSSSLASVAAAHLAMLSHRPSITLYPAVLALCTYTHIHQPYHDTTNTPFIT